MSAKLFLGGIATTVTKEDIEEHFSPYGIVTDAVVMYKDGKHRGFGFVTFEREESAEAVLAQAQVIHDRTIDVKPAVPDGQAPPPRGGGGGGGRGGFPAGRTPWNGGGCGGRGGGGWGGECGSGGGAYPAPISYGAVPCRAAPPSYGGGGAYGGAHGGGGGCAYGGGGAYSGGGGCGSYAPAISIPVLPSKGPMRGAPPKGGGKGKFVGETDKVFVGGLPPVTTDDSLHAYFSRYGNLVDVVVMKDSGTQKSRGFGFVRFDSPLPVDQVIADYSIHELDGKWVEVKKAVPQDRMPAPAAAPFQSHYQPPANSYAPKGAYVGGGGKGGGAHYRPY